MTRYENRSQQSISGISSLLEGEQVICKSGISVSIFRSVDEVPQGNWKFASNQPNLFLQKKYLSVVEKNPPLRMKFCYFFFYKENKPIGIAIGQIQYFKADESINDEEKKGGPCFFMTFFRFLKGLVSSQVEFNILVNGSLLLTGEHGFYFDPKVVRKSKAFELLHKAMDYGMEVFQKKGEKLAGSLAKDFHEENLVHSRKLIELGYNEFTVQPSMLMDVKREWKTFDDYMDALHSKYRVRVRRAFKKAAALEKREFDEKLIHENLPQLYQLYLNIAENSGFNMVNLNDTYLLGLKKQFPDRFRMIAYYLDDKLIGYFTTFLNGDELEAHFLGFEPKYNHDLQIYLNMLYDMVRIGIDSGAKQIIFARTAMAIKSSVGAVAHEMYCYMRHRNSFPNKFIKPLLHYLRPEKDWEPRHPFK
jgi:hypothetical protein